MFTFLPGSRPRYHIVFSHPVTLGSPWLWQLLRLSLFLMTFTVSRSTGQVCDRMSLYFNLSHAFFKISLGLWVWRRKVREEKWHFQHIISRVHTIDMIHDCWCWFMTADALRSPGRIALVRFPHSQVTLFPPFLSVLLGRESSRAAPTSGMGRLPLL